MKKLILMTFSSLIFISAKAQIPQPDPDTTAKHFMIVASIGNLQEISASQLANHMAKDADVRSFAQMMIKDHGDGENQLKQLAETQHINLPTAAIGGIQPDINLKNAGSNFDKLYVHAMVCSHGDAVQTFENYAINGKNPAVKAFAKQMLPTLRAHLAAIMAIDKELNRPGK